MAVVDVVPPLPSLYIHEGFEKIRLRNTPLSIQQLRAGSLLSICLGVFKGFENSILAGTTDAWFLRKES